MDVHSAWIKLNGNKQGVFFLDDWYLLSVGQFFL